MSFACSDAAIGFIGVIVGGLIGVGGQIATHFITTRQATKDDKAQMELLKEMLDDPKHDWRYLSTLSRVIGADDATTTRLLIRLGARGSTSGEAAWAWKSKHPLVGMRQR